jgi:membrane protein required for colicin V production
MPPYNTIDIIIVGLLAVGLLRGIMRGLSGELAGFIALGVALFAGYNFYEPFGIYLSQSTSMNEIQADTVSFVVILIGAMLLMWALRVILKSVMEFTFKGALERAGGAVAGLLRYAVFLSFLILLTRLFGQGTIYNHVIEDSFIGRHTSAWLLTFYEQVADYYPDLPMLPGEEPAVVPPMESEPEQP